MSQKSGPGWVRGTGRRDCPVGYPIKGNEPSNVYYEPGDPGYPQVIPEMCFEDAKTAEKVGFTRTGNHGGGAKAAGAAAAAAAAAGFVRATGGRECPDGYPIKGNEPSNVFYRPEDPGYAQVVPEVCFADVAEAEKAGFTRVKLEATKKTEPVAERRVEAAKAEPKAAAEPVKATAESAKAAAPPPPPPPPPPPAPVAEAAGGGWMKWLLPLIALAVLAAGIWYFTRDDDEDEPTPTVAATTAATTGDDEEGEATVEAAGTDAEGTVEADVAAVEGTVEAGADAVVAGAEGTVEAAAGTVEAAVSAVEGTVEAVAAGDASPEASPAASPVAADGLVLTARDIAYDPTTLTIQAADEPVT
ncbi:MAG: hypothetical protein M9947_13740, partial [Thermomicrobiales bacterium]|nr:hypothetical protein [Thermomicrobiales bacterium]